MRREEYRRQRFSGCARAHPGLEPFLGGYFRREVNFYSFFVIFTALTVIPNSKKRPRSTQPFHRLKMSHATAQIFIAEQFAMGVYCQPTSNADTF